MMKIIIIPERLHKYLREKTNTKQKHSCKNNLHHENEGEIRRPSKKYANSLSIIYKKTSKISIWLLVKFDSRFSLFHPRLTNILLLLLLVRSSSGLTLPKYYNSTCFKHILGIINVIIFFHSACYCSEILKYK
jgi:hypothetical protein